MNQRQIIHPIWHLIFVRKFSLNLEGLPPRIAHSVEVSWEGQLVGGLYGVSLGNIFFGESMFAKEPDASKVAFATMLGHFVSWGIELVDCQVATDHLARFAASNWPQRRFLKTMRELVAHPTRKGPWNANLSPVDALSHLPARSEFEPV